MYGKGKTTGGNKKNRRMTQEYMEIKTFLFDIEQELLYDPQISGGLLLSVTDNHAAALLDALSDAGV